MIKTSSGGPKINLFVVNTSEVEVMIVAVRSMELKRANL